MVKQAMLFDSLSTTWLLIFLLEISNKKPLFTKPASTGIEIFCYKDIIFHGYKILYPYSVSLMLLMREGFYVIYIPLFELYIKNHTSAVIYTFL